LAKKYQEQNLLSYLKQPKMSKIYETDFEDIGHQATKERDGFTK
jgi:hypothetical protein